MDDDAVTLTHEQIRVMLLTKCKQAGGERAFAKLTGISDTLVHLVAAGHRPPTTAIINSLGYLVKPVFICAPMRGSATPIPGEAAQMARVNFYQRASGMLFTDLRLAPLTAVAQLLWLRLVHLIHEMGTDGILDLSGEVGAPFGSYADLRSVLVSRQVTGLVSFGVTKPVTDLGTGSETQNETQENRIETQFDTLIDLCVRRGLLQRPEPNKLGLPSELGLSKRAIAARINGARGGRPRKQGSLMLPIAGGQAETQTETNPRARVDRSDLSDQTLKDRSDQTRARVSEPGPDAEDLAQRLRQQLGVMVQAGDVAPHIGRLGSAAAVTAACTAIRARADQAPRGWAYYATAIDRGLQEGAWGRQEAAQADTRRHAPVARPEQPGLGQDVMRAWGAVLTEARGMQRSGRPLFLDRAVLLSCGDGRAVIGQPGTWLRDSTRAELEALQAAWGRAGRSEQLEVVLVATEEVAA